MTLKQDIETNEEQISKEHIEGLLADLVNPALQEAVVHVAFAAATGLTGTCPFNLVWSHSFCASLLFRPSKPRTTLRFRPLSSASVPHPDTGLRSARPVASVGGEAVARVRCVASGELKKWTEVPQYRYNALQRQLAKLKQERRGHTSILADVDGEMALKREVWTVVSSFCTRRAEPERNGTKDRFTNL